MVEKWGAGSQPVRSKDPQGGGRRTSAVVVRGLLVLGRGERWLSGDPGWDLTGT